MNRHRLLWLFLPLAVILLSEPLLRLADPPGLQYYRRSKLVHAYNPDYTISLRPSSSEYLKHPSGIWEGQFTVNSYGMRDLEEPESGRPKIICLGDSLSMGHGVGDGENFCHLLKSKLNPAQVLNASVDGFGTYAYALRTEELLTELDSVNTILLFPSPTDWWIPERFRERGILPDDEKDELRRDDGFYKSLFRIQFQATEWFYTLQSMKLAQEQLILRRTIFQNDVKAFFRNAIERTPTQTVEVATESTERSLLRERSPCTTEVSEETLICPEPLGEGLECTDNLPMSNPLSEFTQKNLNRLIEITRSHNVRLVVVILPMQEEEIRCAEFGKHHPSGMYALQAKNFFEARKVDVLDLMPYTKSMCGMKERGPLRIEDYFLREDGHLTVPGNIWAANAISEELRKHRIPR